MLRATLTNRDAVFTIEVVRSIQRTLSRGDLTGIAAVCLAVCVIGVSYGATAVTSGLPAWLPIVLSVLVLAGGSEFLFVGIIAAGGGPIAAVLAGLLVNARHLPYGLALPDVLGTGWRRLLGTHVMNDESVAMALGESDRERSRAAYWLCGLGVLLAWPVGALLGVGLGTAVPNPDEFGLDAVFPAVLIALALPALRDRRTRHAALAGAVVAVVAAVFLPAGLPVLLALPAAFVVLTAQHMTDKLRGRRGDVITRMLPAPHRDSLQPTTATTSATPGSSDAIADPSNAMIGPSGATVTPSNTAISYLSETTDPRRAAAATTGPTYASDPTSMAVGSSNAERIAAS